jgi:hypothetical protein
LREYKKNNYGSNKYETISNDFEEEIKKDDQKLQIVKTFIEQNNTKTISCKIDDFDIEINYKNTLQEIFENIKNSTNEEYSYLLNSTNQKLVLDIKDLNDYDIFKPLKKLPSCSFQYLDNEPIDIELNPDLNLLKKSISKSLNKDIFLIVNVTKNNQKIISNINELILDHKYYVFENLDQLKNFKNYFIK